MSYILSIIVPVYKVEKYIEECLDSVFSQLPSSVEIIIINDGTPDRSIEIVNSNFASWLERDQVVLIEQKNAGPGAARNRGLGLARGEYIGFLDSDDVLLKEYFNTVIEHLRSYKPDLVEFGFQRFHERKDIRKEDYKPTYSFNGLHDIHAVRNEIFSVGIWFPSTRIYKREVFQRIRFPVGVFYEDLMIVPYIYLQDLEAFFIDESLIGYRYNPNSTTALHTKPHAKDMYDFYLSLKVLDEKVPIEILRIKTARGIVYFFNELGPLGFPISGVIADIKRIKKRLILLKNLKLPDLLFFVFPVFYMRFDKIRLSRLKRNSR